MSDPLVPATVHSVTAPAASAQALDSEKTDGVDKFCRSPVSGIVNRVNVAPGQTITENELIMVIEAMKMETNVTAPRSGIVKRTRVAAGDSVKVNQIVVELE